MLPTTKLKGANNKRGYLNWTPIISIMFLVLMAIGYCLKKDNYKGV
jgi:hypothetical protein